MATRSGDPRNPGLGWIMLGLAGAALAGYVAASTIRAGAVNGPLVLVGVGAVGIPVLAYLADRTGQRWGRTLALAFGIVLMGLAALGEWFFWIGDVQGASYQKIGVALAFAAIEGLTAGGTGLLVTRGMRPARVATVAVVAMLLPAVLGQVTVWSGS
jgi:hypothetical protein